MNRFLFLLCLTFFAAISFAMNSNAASESGHGDEHGSGIPHRDNTALFPQPKADPSKATPPEAAQILEPALNSVHSADSVTLKWSAVDSADHYHVQVATDPNFKWLKTDDHNVKATELTVTGLEKGKKYFWRVAGWKKSNLAATNKGNFSSSVFVVK